jgi:hypothetical protein
MTRRLQINMLILMHVSSNWIRSLRKDMLCKWDHVAITRYLPLQNSFLVGTKNQRSPPYRNRLVIIIIASIKNGAKC